MTDKKSLNQIGELKSQLNTPKTETRIILNDWQPEVSEVKKSKLSPAARNKVVNHNKPYQSQNQESYGPCSYYGCNHKGSFFDLQIGIQGCKWWATNYETSLPGYWKPSPTVSYYSKESLWLSNVGDAYNADSLIGQKSLYTVGTLGQYAGENDEFCGGAQNFIREYARKHEQGYTITETITLPSETTRATKWTIKAGVALGSAIIPGATPLALATAGGLTWAGSEAAKSLCDSDKTKHFWGIIGNTGKDAVEGAAYSSVFRAGGQLLGEEATGSKEVGRLLGNEVGKWESWKDGAQNVGEVNTHFEHLKVRNYDSSCPICNSK